MTLQLLDHFLLSQLFTFLMLLCRIGACIMVMPGIGDNYIPMRVKILLTASMAILLTPALASSMPAMPASPISLTLVILSEVLIGVFIGMIARLLVSAMNAAGTIIANQSSLAIASVFDANAGVQTAIVSNFFTITVICLFFILGLHHLVIGAVIASYGTFPVGTWPNIGDMSDVIIRTVADAFLLGVQFSMPHIVFSLILYMVAGIMARLMPTFQVFFVMMPAQILAAFMLLIVVIAPMMTIYMGTLNDRLLELTPSIGRTPLSQEAP